MTVQEIRTHFFDFFASKQHQIVPSAPMVVKNDPTLMFTNAGMNQFKDFFLGNAVPKNPRVANSQKCLRVSGKHNDLEEVGVDTYHHTMFEMLGNWSFGDYFKEEAISWAWELLTEVYKIPKDRLYVTVFEGDAKDGVPKDQESYDIWKRFIAEDRIIMASKKDNFWEMGDTGPCGPCTEIHVDNRIESERAKGDGKQWVNQDHPQVVEIWNNVFMQFNRKADGSLEPLPATHVDTGMGLERLAMTMQGKTSNYDIDLFQALINHMEQVSGKKYGADEPTDIALRVIADHIRAIAFSIADGQLPSNTGAGYVIRRILRRAVRYGYQTLGLKEPFMAGLSGVLANVMGDAFNELNTQKNLIEQVIREEELSFFRTLEQGLKRIENLMDSARANNKTILSGADVFELYDTFGFPFDLTSLIARENNLSVDEDAFNAELQQQKNRSRAATAIETADWVELKDDYSEEFVGYDVLKANVEIVKYRKVSQKQRVFYQLVFNLTPFYAEGGGQVGDTGTISNDFETITIFDTKKENGLIVHLSETLPEHLNAQFSAKVDVKKRQLSTSNHSATHLLHHALRTVLGTHVEQKGSLVNPSHLRFDFSHFSKVTDEQLAQIEAMVVSAIRENQPLVEKRNVPIEVATEMGAMALFGEKYGDTVRVIQFGDSVELCGGTHVQSTGQISLFKLRSESAVAAGIRRIEAITNEAVEHYYAEQETKLETVNELLRNPKDLPKAVEDLIARNNQLMKQVEFFKKEQAKQVKVQLKSSIQSLGDVSLLEAVIDLDAASVKDILFQLKGEVPNLVSIIGSTDEDKCAISICIDENLSGSRNWHAGTIVKTVAPLIQGGGGGQPFFATAGGKDASGLQNAIREAKSLLSLN
ncbi:MAG: alanine--tRNA ligase [Candidatus Fluviicola riflensis]|nr:MAG: alanine--tRNA ligase [Candidatus Fluviicola riflensis]OGS79040.1 MAG: alanine--tRNA ligase [Candidatus Fluviicola riflensis]OGS86063.1 MAG: alanine--tRNA ligase [Fluviicola sp. RIFCSPHIGHO2_12_FULL_43_24]OGS86472.1 MAG: alanine--tRNA ligase [Fluviicola sp. RIFCSPHIGHO2_01_FULL_43_53]